MEINMNLYDDNSMIDYRDSDEWKNELKNRCLKRIKLDINIDKGIEMDTRVKLRKKRSADSTSLLIEEELRVMLSNRENSGVLNTNFPNKRSRIDIDSDSSSQSHSQLNTPNSIIYKETFPTIVERHGISTDFGTMNKEEYDSLVQFLLDAEEAEEMKMAENYLKQEEMEIEALLAVHNSSWVHQGGFNNSTTSEMGTCLICGNNNMCILDRGAGLFCTSCRMLVNCSTGESLISLEQVYSNWSQACQSHTKFCSSGQNPKCLIKTEFGITAMYCECSICNFIQIVI